MGHTNLWQISYFVGLFSWHCAFLKGKKSLQINAMLCWLITFIIRWNMSIPVWQCPNPQDMNTDWMIVWKWCKSCAMDTYGRFWTDVFDSVLHHRDQNTKGLREYLFISFNSVHLQKIAKKKIFQGTSRIFWWIVVWPSTFLTQFMLFSLLIRHPSVYGGRRYLSLGCLLTLSVWLYMTHGIDF